MTQPVPTSTPLTTDSPAIAGARGNPALVELYQEVADCPACGLARTRTQTVPGSGPAPAEVMCIGEAPGAREDEHGLPFIGAAGRYLDELLGDIGLSRESVHIANVVKCRPPGNRDPAPEEMAACQPFLDRQIELVDPLLIVTLGRFSMARWFSGATISRIHGQPQRFGDRLVMPMFHPAAALRRGDLRAVIAADFAQIPRLLEQARAARLAGTGYPPAAPGSAGDAAASTAGTGQRTPEPAAPAARQASPASQRSLL
ncbi:MAG: uracil-DNA glycosylase [Chloroflexi bacterium]|nr:uracil-DNA glycosylase [Chloroflexota bacterium]